MQTFCLQLSKVAILNISCFDYFRDRVTARAVTDCGVCPGIILYHVSVPFYLSLKYCFDCSKHVAVLRRVRKIAKGFVTSSVLLSVRMEHLGLLWTDFDGI